MMKEIFGKIKAIYSANPKIQLTILFLGIFGIMYLVYSLTTGSPKKSYSNLNKAAKSMQMTSAPKKEEKPKTQSQQSKNVESSQSKVKKEQQEQRKQEKENAQNLNTIRKNRFDSDIKKAFDFDNQF